MAIAIVPFSSSHVESAKALNRRLSEHGVHYKFPECEIPDWLPRRSGSLLYHEYFVAEDQESLRGGYIYKHQQFDVAGVTGPVGFFRLPISEGLYDSRFTTLATQFLLHAVRKNPLLFSLGIGGYSEPLAKLERGAGWMQWTLPFHFQVLKAGRFLANIVHLRNRPLRRWMLDIGRWVGLGPIAIHAWQRHRRRRLQGVSVQVDEVAAFGPWADEVWQQSQAHYSFIAVRNAENLTAIYPPDDQRFIRLRIRVAGNIVGWAVVMANTHQGHKYFGNMRLGSLVDCLSVPGKERVVVESATRRLKEADCDLIVTNQSHKAWCIALDDSGYLRGPSNFIFSASKKLVGQIDAVDPNHESLHLNRGDGDGPIHL